MTNRSPPLVITRPGMMARVRGILSLTVVPSPEPAENIDDAADLLNVGLHHVHADAAPGNIGHGLRRREPRAGRSGSAPRDRSAFRPASGRRSPFSTAFCLTRATSMPAPSSPISMLTCPPS